MKTIFTLITALLFGLLIGNSACSPVIHAPMNDNPKNKTAIDYSHTSVEFVQHKGQNQKGEVMDYEEWYVRMSVQDYFIKWCESGVSQSEVESLLAKQKTLIKTLEVEMEIKNGDWDNCDPNEIAASRGGKYVIIKKIHTK